MSEELINVKVDRPLGSAHPEEPSLIYPINYGYVPGVIAGDGEEQDVYILGVDIPVDEFTGRKIAIVHRNDDVEDKWVVAPENISYNKQQIEEMVHFQEQFFDSYIEIINDEMWDAYDFNENKLGYSVGRSMAKNLPEGVYHVVVIIYTLSRDGKILVTQRAKNKTYPMRWEVTGGSILSGEEPRQGAVRELREETGITKEEDEIIGMYDYVDESKHAIYHAYINVIDTDTPVKLQEGETMNYQFLTYDEFMDLVNSERFVSSEQKRFKKFENIIKTIIFGEMM